MSTESVTRGSSLRAPRSEDVASIAALVDAIENALYGSSQATEDDVRFIWSWPRFDLDRDARLATAQGALCGYAWLWGPRAPEPEWDSRLHVLPDAPPFVSEQLLEWMEGRLRERCRLDGETRASRLAIPCASVDRGKLALLERRGYAPVRTFYRMERELEGAWDAPSWPAEAEVAPLLVEEDEHELYVVLEESFSEHYRFLPEPFEDWRRRNIGHVDFAPELSFLVRKAGEPIAASANFRTGDEGMVGMLGVRRPWRRLGLGRALLLRSFDAFRDAGLRVARLGVDAGNADQAVALYESVGMTIARQDLLFEKTLPIAPSSPA